MLCPCERLEQQHGKNLVVDGAMDGAAMAASVAAPASVRHGAETAKPQQDSSPTRKMKKANANA